MPGKRKFGSISSKGGRTYVKKMKTSSRRKSKTYRGLTKKQVMYLINGHKEKKFFDTVNATTIDRNGSVISLCDIPQGDTDSTRDGDAVNPTSLQFGLTMTVADSYNVFRCIIFRWKPNSGLTAPTPGRILQLVASANAVNSPVIWDYKSQFNILYDKTWVLGTINVCDNQVREIQEMLPLANVPIHYTAGSIVGSDKIFVLFISDSGAIPDPALNYYFRVAYTDS